MIPLNSLPLALDTQTPQLRTASRLALLLEAMPGDDARRTGSMAGAMVRGPGPSGALLAALATGAAEPAVALVQQSPTPGAAAAPQLSEAARMLAQLGMRPRTPLELMLNFNRTGSEEAADASASGGRPAPAGDAAGISMAAPLADIAPEELATMLRSVVTRSGLFYESHLHDWARGQRPLADLAAQPQMRWQRESNPAHQDSAQLASASSAGSATLAPDGSAPVSEARVGGIPEPLRELVSRQLDVLDSRQLHLHLSTGAERPVELMIGQERRQDATDSEAGTWVTELNCYLPELGEVKARLRLQGSRVAIAITAQDADRSDWLDARLGELRIMLERSGLAAPQLDVGHGDDA